MDLGLGETRAIAWVAHQHQDANRLRVTILMENNTGWLSVEVHGPATRYVPPPRYIVSPTGRVWETPDGTVENRKEPPVRDADYDRHSFEALTEEHLTVPPNHPNHVAQLTNHIACLDEEQIKEVRATLNNWHDAATH